MTTTTTSPEVHATDEPAWVEAGRAWGHAAADWAFLFEPYARDAVETIFTAADVGTETRFLDVACGSGLALGRAHRLGATTAGIDASAALVDIARRRAPAADLVVGDMFHLPRPDESFDLVTSFNGIWGGCTDAVTEMARVLRPGGMAAITFWGPGRSLDLRDFFIAIGSTHHDVATELMDLARIGDPGVAEEMLEAAGLRPIERGATDARFEWPDEDVAWRALRSPGVAVPPLQAVGEDELRRRGLDAIARFRADDGSYLLNNELTHVLAVKPPTT